MAKHDTAFPSGDTFMARHNIALPSGDKVLARHDAALPTDYTFMLRHSTALPSDDTFMARHDTALPTGDTLLRKCVMRSGKLHRVATSKYILEHNSPNQMGNLLWRLNCLTYFMYIKCHMGKDICTLQQSEKMQTRKKL